MDILMHAGSALDNSTYDECQGTVTHNLTINDDSDFGKEFENPIYSDETIEAGHNSASNATNTQLQNTSHYEEVDFESTAVDDNNTSSTSGGVIMKGAISEGVYELPPNLDGPAGDCDENCYSTLDPTYSQLQAHLRVPKSGVQCPPNDVDDYSRLQYK